jgi:hypothetical protein
MMEGALDSIRTTRYQIGTLSHLSEDLKELTQVLREYIDRLELFASKRRNTAIVAAAIIISILLLNHLRGWLAMRFSRRPRASGKRIKRLHKPTNAHS